ncbi:alanine racemase [bacterium]|nr:alanine racemase [bacterium]
MEIPREIALRERRPTYSEINLTAFRHNFQLVRRLAGGAKVMGIVKADAYGHGLLEISRELEALNVDYIGVGFLEEGIALREAGINTPILVLGGVAGYQINSFLEYNLELTASSKFIASEIDRRARRMDKKAIVHLKIDTGMNRIGVNYQRAADFMRFAGGLANLIVKGIYTHLAAADSDPEFTKLQLNRFKDVIKSASAIFSPTPIFHVLNSAGLINFPEYCFDMVRTGIMLYGMVPSNSLLGRLDLKPVMSLKSEVVFLKRAAADEGISYDLTYRTKTDTQIVTIPIGYGDGYPVRLSDCGQALIGGKRYPVVGRVCMDQIMVDAGDAMVRIGEEVTLIGKQGDDCITVEEICSLTGAIPYEIPIGTTSRVPRLYIKDTITDEK